MRLTWDQTGQRRYETGVSRGVLYFRDGVGNYTEGHAWNGLTTVTESPSGAESNKQYADNMVYLNLKSAEEFGATVEAFTYPEAFARADGSAQPSAGLALGQQRRETFGMAYRTEIGNDLEGTDHGYKLHLVYGADAAPSEKAYATINDSPEAITFSWELTTTPAEVGNVGGTDYKPTAIVTVDSTKVPAASLTALENALYGTEGADPRLPLPAEVIGMFAGALTEVATETPTFDSTTDVITIPTVTGVVYEVDGEPVTGTVGPITEPTVVNARAADGYTLTADSDTDWTFRP